jgi:hypothetical protein
MDMYCTACGQSVSEDRFGNLIHEYQTRDAHNVEVSNE